MKRTNLAALGLAAAALLALPAISRAANSIGIENSPHDFSTNSLYQPWNSRHGVCSSCHSVHNTDAAQVIPLWNHKTTTASFTPYSSPSLNASVGAPNGKSLACLSCHDGTVAVNEGSGGLGTNAPILMGVIDPAAVIGPDLHTTHPISFVYDAALATADGALENPTTYKIGDPKTRLTVQTPPVPTTWPAGSVSIVGKTIDEALLDGNHRVQCTSCHDVHKMVGSAPGSGILVKISGTDADNRGSTICRTCHVK
jgi:hypothetical protein